MDKSGRPVGAKPYQPGVTKMEHSPLEADDWIPRKPLVKEGWPDLAKEWQLGRFATDYNTFSSIRPASLPAGSNTTLKRVVSHDADAAVNGGAFWNRELPIDGEDLRAGSAVKEDWNKNGQFVELQVPPKGDPVWKELHALQERAAGGPVPYKEELKFWEGPASSQIYKVKEGGKVIDDQWYLAGGKPQQFFDREQMKLLQGHGFITERKATGFKDYDPEVLNANGSRGNIVPKDGPFLQIVPLDEAVPQPAKATPK